MNFVCVRPDDNQDIVELLAVQHPTKKRNTFQTQWDSALARVKHLNPETWNVDQVFSTLEHDLGWTIMKLDTKNSLQNGFHFLCRTEHRRGQGPQQNLCPLFPGRGIQVLLLYRQNPVPRANCQRETQHRETLERLRHPQYTQ